MLFFCIHLSLLVPQILHFVEKSIFIADCLLSISIFPKSSLAHKHIQSQNTSSGYLLELTCPSLASYSFSLHNNIISGFIKSVSYGSGWKSIFFCHVSEICPYYPSFLRPIFCSYVPVFHNYLLFSRVIGKIQNV